MRIVEVHKALLPNGPIEEVERALTAAKEEVREGVAQLSRTYSQWGRHSVRLAALVWEEHDFLDLGLLLGLIDDNKPKGVDKEAYDNLMRISSKHNQLVSGEWG